MFSSIALSSAGYAQEPEDELLRLVITGRHGARALLQGAGELGMLTAKTLPAWPVALAI